MPQGTLYLAPTGLGGSDIAALLPPLTLAAVHRIGHFVAENPRSARAFLQAIGHPRRVRELHIATLDEHTPPGRVAELLHPLLDGSDCAILSEAGCPAVADPGAALVRAAHRCAIRVVPLVGPSALLLALMASGMNGQRFSFHGYLPVERGARARRLVDLESESEKKSTTQVFIEAPYRNQALFEAILRACRPDTLLCLATQLTLPDESVRTQPVSLWKGARPGLERRPTVFLLYRDTAARPQKR
jgi:16S rRNA (cytidine1402-2'-O)-methyltransferase